MCSIATSIDNLIFSVFRVILMNFISQANLQRQDIIRKACFTKRADWVRYRHHVHSITNSRPPVADVVASPSQNGNGVLFRARPRWFISCSTTVCLCQICSQRNRNGDTPLSSWKLISKESYFACLGQLRRTYFACPKPVYVSGANKGRKCSAACRPGKLSTGWKWEIPRSRWQACRHSQAALCRQTLQGNSPWNCTLSRRIQKWP